MAISEAQLETWSKRSANCPKSSTMGRRMRISLRSALSRLPSFPFRKAARALSRHRSDDHHNVASDAKLDHVPCAVDRTMDGNLRPSLGGDRRRHRRMVAARRLHSADLRLRLVSFCVCFGSRLSVRLERRDDAAGVSAVPPVWYPCHCDHHKIAPEPQALSGFDFSVAHHGSKRNSLRELLLFRRCENCLSTEGR